MEMTILGHKTTPSFLEKSTANRFAEDRPGICSCHEVVLSSTGWTLSRHRIQLGIPRWHDECGPQDRQGRHGVHCFGAVCFCCRLAAWLDGICH